MKTLFKVWLGQSQSDNRTVMLSFTLLAVLFLLGSFISYIEHQSY